MNQDQFKKFLLIWFGEFFSIIGSGITMFALGIHVLKLTGNTSSYVYILLSVFLPSFLLKPLGGILADRHDRRIMMIIGDIGASIGLIFIFIMMSLNLIEIWHFYFGIILSSIFTALQQPAYKALVTDLLDEKNYAKASGLMQLATSSQFLISPFIAGILIFYVEIQYVFLIDVSTLLFASLMILITTQNKTKKIKNSSRNKKIKINSTKFSKENKVLNSEKKAQNKKSKKLNFLNEFKEGLNELKKTKGVLSLVLITATILFFVGMLQSLYLPFLLLYGDSKTAGISQSISATGMIVGSLILGIFGKGKKENIILATALLFSGIFFSLMGFFNQIFFITTTAFFFFITLPFINTSIEVMIRKNIENKKQARVWSLISSLTYLGSILAFLISGILVDKIMKNFLLGNTIFAQLLNQIFAFAPGKEIAITFAISGITISIIGIFMFFNKKVKNLTKKKLLSPHSTNKT